MWELIVSHISLEGKMKKIMWIVFLYQMVGHAASFSGAAQTPELLVQAQQAYLEGDVSKALIGLKRAYMSASTDVVVQKNIVKSFSQIKDRNLSAQVNVGWTLPKEIISLRAEVFRRFDSNVVSNRITITGKISSVDEISSFQLISYPENVILDKANKVGTFKDTNEVNGPEFNYRTNSSPFPIPSGLYLLKITTKTGSHVDGWFMLDENANATTQPTILNYNGNPVFNTGTPEIKWLDYFSPQYNKDTEARSVSIWVGKAHVDQGAWSFWNKDMNLRSAVIGSNLSNNNGWSKGPLENGDYYAMLHFQESHLFGPIKIVRRSATVKYFSIQK
jgi:hypothetical protein